MVAKDMKLDSVPGSISVKAEEGTNMLTISVTGTNAELSYKTLKSVIKIIRKWHSSYLEIRL